MRRLIAGNWKMHGLAGQLVEIEAIAASAASTSPNMGTLLCLPATLISRAVQRASGRVLIGGEDCRAEAAGAFTGDMSAEMLRDAGASAVIVGHSERRRYSHDTSADVARKAKAARRAGLLAIICIGETELQRHYGQALARCGEQIAGSIPDGPAGSDTLAVAYEPRWAIGTGHIPAANEIVEMHQHIRQCLTKRFGAAGGAEIRILYGGSVTPSNAREILALPNVGGALIGGASLRAADFIAILDAAE